MQEFIIKKTVWLHQKILIQAAQKTLISLFPFVLLLAISRLLAVAVFSDHGLMNQLFSLSFWLPFYKYLSAFFSNFAAIISGLTGLLATYFAAKYTSSSDGSNHTEAAAITAVIFHLIIYSKDLFSSQLNSDNLLQQVSLPVDTNLIIAILLGYLVGQIFRHIDSNYQKITEEPSKPLKTIFLSLTLAVLLNVLFYLASVYNLFTLTVHFFTGLISSKGNLLATFSNALLTTFFAWIGVNSVYHSGQFTDDVLSLENLAYALKHHTTQNIPYPYTETTLYHGFGAFGGVGSLLALIIAILLVSKYKKDKAVSSLGMFPALFNNGSPLMIGIPILFNFFYLIPFLLAPILNMLIAYLALAARIMPPLVYPVPAGTPSPLIAFIGTGGSLRALGIGLVAFISNIFLYIPFVKFHDKIQEKIAAEEGQQHE